MKKVEINLAKKYDLVVGDTFQLFYRAVVKAPNPYIYSIVAKCEKGKNFPRYFEYTPLEEGTHELSISVYDQNLKRVGFATTTLFVVAPKKPKRPYNVLVIGASMSEEGVWANEVERRINKFDGSPEGLGFNCLKFVGTKKCGDVCLEAYGGWSFSRFTSNTVGAVWIETNNDKSDSDRHSIWVDEKGGLWQIETIQRDYIKLNRLPGNESVLENSGTISHYKNARNTTPLKYTSYFNETISPFYDQDCKDINFKTYLKKIGEEKIDLVYILLGANGRLRSVAINNTTPKYCKYVVDEGKILVDRIKKDIPDVKVKIIAPPIGSINGGCGNAYGAELPITDTYFNTEYIMELNKAYEKWANEPKYRDFLEFVHLSAQVDSENVYPTEDKPVNCRSSKTEKLDIDAVHPTIEGQMQFADAIYRNLVKEICK